MQRCCPVGIEDFSSPQADKLFNILKLLAIMQLILGIITLMVDLMGGLGIIIGAALLYYITHSHNWCICLIYVFISL